MSDSEQWNELEALAKAATPGPWYRETVGHATVRKLAGKIARQLGVKLPNGAPASTDGTWVVTGDNSKSVAFIGNGPRQTENGDYLAALSPDVVLRLIAAARVSGPQTGLVDVAQDLIDFLDGGGFRANFPEDLFARLRAAIPAGEPAGLREAAQAMLDHHDRQNGVYAGSPNDCEQGRALRAVLASRAPA